MQHNKVLISIPRLYCSDIMAKSFACKDIGMTCGFRTRANTEEELMQKIAAHAQKAHKMASIDAATLTKVKAAIREA